MIDEQKKNIVKKVQFDSNDKIIIYNNEPSHHPKYSGKFQKLLCGIAFLLLIYIFVIFCDTKINVTRLVGVICLEMLIISLMVLINKLVTPETKSVLKKVYEKETHYNSKTEQIFEQETYPLCDEIFEQQTIFKQKTHPLCEEVSDETIKVLLDKTLMRRQEYIDRKKSKV